MPRVIPLGRRALTGYLPTRFGTEAIAYESRLERDCLMLLQFDHRLQSLKSQPITIHYELAGRRRRYTPDILAGWAEAAWSPWRHARMLFEVKPAADLVRNAEQWREKWKTIHRYADEHGYGFAILTESEIRIPRLKNAELLLPYWDRRPEPELSVRLRNIVQDADGEATMGHITQMASEAGWPVSDVVAGLRHHLLHRIFAANLDRPIEEGTCLRLPEQEAVDGGYRFTAGKPGISKGAQSSD